MGSVDREVDPFLKSDDVLAANIITDDDGEEDGDDVDIPPPPPPDQNTDDRYEQTNGSSSLDFDEPKRSIFSPSSNRSNNKKPLSVKTKLMGAVHGDENPSDSPPLSPPHLERPSPNSPKYYKKEENGSLSPKYLPEQKRALYIGEGGRDGDSLSYSFDKKQARREAFKMLALETTNSPYHSHLLDRFADSERTLFDYISYKLENAISQNDNVKFYVLIGLSVVFVIIFCLAWKKVSKGDSAHPSDDKGTLFLVLSVILSMGYDGTIVELDEQIIMLMTIIVGVTLIAILIGLITDSVNAYMSRMSDGSSKVVEKGHTLILGWNEASTRATCQIAFLRQVLAVQNESWSRRLFPWTRVVPSTPVAAAPIVILTEMDKVTLEQKIREAFDARNIPRRYTEVGRDVVVRQGDPTNAHDLVRVAAHHATSILIMMTSKDEEEQKQSEGTADNSATVRTVLALRNVIFSNGSVSKTFPRGMRVVVQLEKPSIFLEETTFVDPDGVSALFPQELSRTVNSLLFFCAAKPGLSRVIMDVLDFQTASLRCRPALTVKAGPNNEAGWCVGKTIEEVLLNNCWSNAIALGCDDNVFNVFDGEEDTDQTYNTKYAAGIMGDPDRVVKDTDAIIFLSSSSTPHVDASLPDFEQLGKAVEIEISENLKGLDQSGLIQRSVKPVKDILICGWKNIWDEDANRIKRLLGDIYVGLGAGSTVTFATRKPRIAFNKLLLTSKVGFKIRGDNWIIEGTDFEGLEVRHFGCDPVKVADMERLFSDRAFDCAIVLGTAAGLDMPAAAQDSRVLTILLILRRVSKQQHKTLHIVAENQQDQTSTLAVVPRTGMGGYEPDFINTQAIIARTLCLNLAYPQIQDAVSELITNHREDAPNFDIINAEDFGLVGVTASLGILRCVLLNKYDHRAVGIGWFEKRKMIICPPLTSMVTFTREHRLIIMIQKTPQAQQKQQTDRVQDDPQDDGLVEEQFIIMDDVHGGKGSIL